MSDEKEEHVDVATANAAVSASLQLASVALSSAELFRNSSTVRIEHAGQTYWLRLTRGNKLILTK